MTNRYLRLRPASLLATIALFSLASVCYGQLSFQFRNGKAGYQTGPNFVSYDGGLFEVILVDGSYSVSGCAGANPGPAPIPPDPMGCPLGTNAYFTGFGESAGLTGHWSLTQAPIAARLFEINRPELFQVLSAPPSLMKRPQALPVIDKGLNIGYSYLEPPYQQYRIANYIHRIRFLPTQAERVRQDNTIPPGSYIFGYPMQQTSAQVAAGLDPYIIPVPVTSPMMPESYPGMAQSPVKSGFRFINGKKRVDGTSTDGHWFDGMLELDPVFLMTIEWEGIINRTNANTNSDRLFLWVSSRRSATPLQMPSGANVLYPIPGLGVTYEVPVDKMISGNETLPPFYHSWAIGDEVVLYLRFERNFANSTTTVKDTSFRVWALPIRFITTFSGFVFTNLPPDATDEERDPNADFDLDGFSNFLEYAAGTDPDDILDTPPPGFPNLISTLVGGKLSARVPKRLNVGGSLTYEMEWSTDMVTWTPIDKVADPVWDVVETDAALTATAKVAGVPAVAFLRAKLILNY